MPAAGSEEAVSSLGTHDATDLVVVSSRVRSTRQPRHAVAQIGMSMQQVHSIPHHTPVVAPRDLRLTLDRLGTVTAAARAAGVGRTALYRHLGSSIHLGRKWPTDAVAGVIQMIADGFTPSEIAAKLKVTTAALHQVAYDYGLQARPDAGVTARNCMCCRYPFHSSGIGNRLCPRCKRNDDGAADYSCAGSTGHRVPRRGIA